MISEWTGFEQTKVLKMLKQVDSDFALTSKLNGLVKEEQKKIEEERKKKQEEEEAKKLKKDGANQEATNEELAELEEKKLEE